MSEKVEAIFQSETDLELLNLQNIESTLNVFQFSTLNDKSDNFRKIQLDYSSIDSLKENIIVLSHEINNPIFIA